MSLTTIPTITKKHYLAGQQCPKLVWHIVNEPASIPPPDPQVEDLMQQGREVGALARQLFPHGIHITPLSKHEALAQTQAALPLRKPIFEAAFQSGNYFTRPDILVAVDGSLWDAVEVKAGTIVEDVYIDDVAFQAYVLAAAGIRVSSYSLLLVNNKYVRDGEIDPTTLFIRRDVTALVLERMTGVKARLARTVATITQPAAPEMEIGRQCHQPYKCPILDRCWSFLPQHNVTELYRGGQRLRSSGTWHFRDRPHPE